METLFFWREWERKERFLFVSFATITLVNLIYGAYTIFTGIDNVIQWEVVNKLDQLKGSIYQFDRGLVNFSIPVDNYVIFQYFEGSDLHISHFHVYVYLVFLVVSINLIMAVLPSFSKFWFYAGLGGFIGFMVLLNLNQIDLFNQNDNSALLIVLGLYLAPGYYFREFNPSLPVLWRFLIYSLIAVVIGVLFHQFAGVERPFLYIANYGIYAPVIIAVFFILSVAHEIIYGFIYLITRSNTPDSKNSLAHFIVISLSFLAYVAITYMHYTRQIRWDLIYLNPFLLLGIAMIIGLWGFKKREELYAEMFSFKPFGALIYLGFAILTMSTIAYLSSIGNDPFIEVFEDAILYSQLGFGILYFIYIIANFSSMLVNNMRVSKIVYQSRIFPFFVFRIGGVIAVGFIFFQSGIFPYYQSLAGYYNNLGDVFLSENQLDLAREYYENASSYEHQNHRSNYAMATIGRRQKDKFDEAYYFENSLLKNPTEYAYVNLGNVYIGNNQFFEGLFKVREGLEKFPYSPHILNNLGYFYSRTEITDSAYYFFNLANNASGKHRVPVTNMYGLLAQSGIYIPIDSLDRVYKVRNYKPARANQLAILNNFRIPESEKDLIDGFGLVDVADFTYLYNAGVNRVHSSDTVFFNQLKAIVDTTQNSFYINRVDIIRAMNYYFTHQTGKTFGILDDYSSRSMFNLEYLRIMGKLALQLDCPELAVRFFEQTNINKDENDLLHLTIAQMEAGDHYAAQQNLNELVISASTDVANAARIYLDIIKMEHISSLDALPDEKIYLINRYRPDLRKERSFSSLVADMKDPYLRDMMHLERVEYLIDMDSMNEAVSYYERMDLQSGDSLLAQRKNRIAYRLDIILANNNSYIDYPGILPVNHPNYLYDLLLESSEKLKAGDTTGLSQAFLILGTWDPYFEMGVIHAADYFNNTMDDIYRAYKILTDAYVLNPYSLPLGKKIVSLSVELNMYEYAVGGLQSLERQMDETAYRDYREEVLSLIREKQNQLDPWDQE